MSVNRVLFTRSVEKYYEACISGANWTTITIIAHNVDDIISCFIGIRFSE